MERDQGNEDGDQEGLPDEERASELSTWGEEKRVV